MKAEVVGFSIILLFTLHLNIGWSQEFIQEGRVIFERRTNLEKRFSEEDKKRWMRNTDLSKPQIDKFELIFNDTAALFRPILEDAPSGMSDWLTMKNTSFQNKNQGIRKQSFSFFGTTVLLEDVIRARDWRMTESKRNIAGYDCRQAVWEANDSTRIYAWYAEELIPSFGPETFNGLPGIILGLAVEDGGVVYFAKEIKVKKADFEDIPKGKKKDWYTEEELRALIKERFTSFGSAADRLMNDVFMW